VPRGRVFVRNLYCENRTDVLENVSLTIARYVAYITEPRGARRVFPRFVHGSFNVKRAATFLRRLACDERGGEVLEYVLIAGLIVVATIVVIGAVGTKVLARWTTVNSGM
jgi:Flp pilus assembly pilin Flp